MITAHAHGIDHAYVVEGEHHEAAKVRPSEKPQNCNWCKSPATKSFLWAEGKAYIPACDSHHQRTIDHIRREYDEPDAVHTVRKSAAARDMNRYFRGGVSDWSDIPGLFEDRYTHLNDRHWAKQPVESVPLDSLHATQRQVWDQHLDRHRSGQGDAEDHPRVINHDGRNWLYDGHHRAINAIDDGETHIQARVWHSGRRTTGRFAQKSAHRDHGEPGIIDCWVCGGVGYLPGDGDGCQFCDESGHLSPSEQRDAHCPCGQKITYTADGGDWLTHLDGSTSHDKGEVPQAPDGSYPGVADAVRMQRTGGKRFSPTKRIFGPTHGLDKRLFSADHLKHDVRTWVMNTLGAFWEPVYGPTWQVWSRVYFAGSEASEWTSAELIGNNDFDVLIGVHYDRMREHLGGLVGMMNDEQITNALNTQLRELLIPRTDPSMIPIEGHPEGPFSVTWYVNQDSWDIRDIKPYAAYNVTMDAWAVRPPHLPEWSVNDLPKGFVAEARAVEDYVRAVLKLPEPYRSQQGDALWRHLHSDRSRAFGPQGEGWYDPGNALEKWLDQSGLWEKLANVHFECVADPAKLLAPVNWTNDPRGAD